MISKEKRLSPKRHVLRLSREVKLKFEGDIEFSITSGDWRAIAQLPVIVHVCIYTVACCLMEVVDLSSDHTCC